MSRTVLIVEDDPIQMEIVSSLVSNHMASDIVRASNGREAIDYIDRAGESISLIVCDLNMPDFDGIEVILELARRRIQTPILFITGAIPAVVQAAELLSKVHGLNVVDLLLKPTNPARLRASLGKVLAPIEA
jgi:putative two-component system response regulator